LREQLVDQVFSLGPIYVWSRQTGELVNTIITGIEEIDATFHTRPQTVGLYTS